jgi:TRAP transporter TAXI family solute receptor
MVRDATKFGFFFLMALLLCLVALGAIWYGGQFRDHHVIAAMGSSKAESYVLGLALKKVVAEHYPRIHIDIRETAGTAENLRMLDSGQALVAAAQADVPVGREGRMLAVLYEDTFQLIVPRNSPVQGIADLRGKRISLPKAGGQFQSFLRIAEHFGLRESDFTFVGRSEADADAAFLAGQADAAFRVRALQNPAILALVRDGNSRFVRIHQAAAMAIRQPALRPSVVPEGAYVGYPPLPPEDLPTVGVMRTLLAHSSAHPDAIEAITAVLMDRRQELARAIPEEFAEARALLAGVKPPGAAGGLEVPVHPGALRHYDKDEPSFVLRHADFLALLVTFVVLLGSWVWELRRWILARQKNRADQYSHEAVLILNRAQASQELGELVKLRAQLVGLLTDVVKQLDEDKISEESFQSFRVVWQIAADMVRERQEELGQAPQARVAAS